MSANSKNKIIVIGLAESGKSTIIKSFTEDKKDFFDDLYSATINYERKNFSFLGNDLAIFDLGGQASFIDKFTGELANFIFSDVLAFVFVIDVSKFEDLSRAKYYLNLSVNNINKFSPKAHGYIFLHKIDLLKQDYVKQVEIQFKEYLLDDINLDLKVFLTSVYQDSVYLALGDLFSNLSTVNKAIDPIINEFVSNHTESIIYGGLITKSGTPLNSNVIFPNPSNIQFTSLIVLSDEYVKNVNIFNNLKAQLINIEFESNVVIIRNLKFDLRLVISFKKTSDHNLSHLIQKVQIFSSTLEKAIERDLQN